MSYSSDESYVGIVELFAEAARYASTFSRLEKLPISIGQTNEPVVSSRELKQARDRRNSKTQKGRVRRRNASARYLLKNRTKANLACKRWRAKVRTKKSAEIREVVQSKRTGRLTGDEVRLITRDLRAGIPKRELARRFDIARTSIDHIERKMRVK